MTAPRRERRPRQRQGALGRGDPGASLIFVFPLFLAYEIGVLFADTLNGVDFVTRVVFAAVDYDPTHYLLVHLGLAAVFFVAVLVLRRRRAVSLSQFWPLLLESSIYALTLGSLIVFVMQNVLGFGPALAAGEGGAGGVGNALVTSMGAGVHEELVFRLGLMGGGAALLTVIGLSRPAAVVLALLISSALFSGAHHLGPQGDAFALGVFTYRLLAGVVFGLIFYFRSLAHAVYAHFLYDAYVLILG